MFEEKWILWQPAMTRSVVGLRSSKALPKVKLAPKKGHGHCWWSVAHLIHYSFLNSEDTITHLRNTLSKFMRCTKNFSACSQHWSIEWAQFFSTTMPDCMPHNQCFKSSTNWAMKVCLIYHKHLTSCQPTTTSSSILTSFFAGKMLPQPAGCRRCFPRVHQILKHGFLSYRNKHTYFSLAKMCLL